MELFDIHCHFMPYVDDGAANTDESEELLEEAAAQGIREICVTPHLRGKLFHSTDDAVREGYHQMIAGIEEAGLPIKLHLSREYYYDEGFLSRLKKDALIPMGPSGVILTEFSYGSSPDTLLEAAETITQAGYQPMFAHVERYGAVQKDIGLIHSLLDMGVYIQVNADSVLRKEGWRQWFCARQLIKEKLAHVVASDGHNMLRRCPNLRSCADLIARKYGDAEAERLFVTNPGAILYGNDLK